MAQPRKEKYGMLFPAKWNPLDIELYCFRTARTIDQGGLGQAEHFWKVVSYLYGEKNPVGNKTKIFIRNPWSEDMINEACANRYIGVGGPANCSKSETFALWVLINYLANPQKVLAGILSTSLKEAKKRIWGSLVEFIRAIPAPGLPLKIIDSQGLIRYNSPTFKASDKASISLIAAERKQEKDAVSKLMGMHNDFVIIVADELSELTDSILEYAMPGGNLTSNPRYQFIGLSNPNGYYDPFAKLWKPKMGWLSISVESERWETEHGIGLHFDALRSPNVTAGRVIYPFLPTIEKIEDAKKAEGGVNAPRFWRMMRGFMCPTGSEDLIYAEADIVKFKGDEPAQWNDEPLINVAGLDPGFTNGGDRSIAFKGTVGTTIHGIRVLQFDLYEELIIDVTKPEDTHSYQIAELFKKFCEKHNVSAFHAAADSTGGGGPFCDILQTVWSRDVLRVNFSGNASDLPVSFTDPTLGKDRYHNRVTEIWYSGKELLRQSQLKGVLPRQAQEMAMRHYDTIGAKKKIVVETKTDMKLRTGGKSPDIADSGFILLALCRERLGFTATASEVVKPLSRGSWSKLRARKNAYGHGMRSHLS
jgi:hypothetical protein